MNAMPERRLILHVDDLGMCHGANAAFLSLARAGQVTCGSVMVPCPWFREIAEAASAESALDLGVHLTLTSEWAGYRWAPISTVGRHSGLIDADGYFWRDVESLKRHLVPEAAEAELRAQIERALSAGLVPTHIDAHMAAAMLPELLDLHLRLAVDYELVPVLPRQIRFAPDPEAYAAAVARIGAAGLPLPEYFRGTLPVAAHEVEAGYERLIRSLPPGLTHMALHCTMPGEFEQISPQHAPWRLNEFALVAGGSVGAWCDAAGIQRIGYRELQQVWRDGLRAAPHSLDAGRSALQDRASMAAGPPAATS